MSDDLTDKQRAFIDHYFACGLNATEAAKRAGYSAKTARFIGSENLTKPNIRAEVDRRLAEHAMPANEVIARIGNMARGDMADFLRTDEEDVTLSWSLLEVPTDKDGAVNIAGTLIDLAMQDTIKPTDRILYTTTVKRSTARLDMLAAGQAGKLHLLKKYSIDDKGKVAIEMYDAKSALDTLAKMHGLLIDKQEVTTITREQAAQMKTDELEAELKQRGLL